MATTTEATLAERLDRLEAIEEIRRVAYRYCHGLDRRDLEAFSAAWHADGAWVLGPDAVVNGIDAIRETVTTGIWPAFTETHHWTSNLAIQVDGDTATATCDVDATVRDTDGNWLRASAVYDDTYERRDGRWGLTRREGTVHFQEPFAKP